LPQLGPRTEKRETFTRLLEHLFEGCLEGGEMDSSETGESASLVVTVAERKALPVRAIPYVTGWTFTDQSFTETHPLAGRMDWPDMPRVLTYRGYMEPESQKTKSHPKVASVAKCLMHKANSWWALSDSNTRPTD
jgi:hypothetical protein